MKPEWKDAPSWANYLVIDQDGLWYWFENKPEPEEYEWRSDGGKVKGACYPYPDWDKTLEQRPSHNDDTKG